MIQNEALGRIDLVTMPVPANFEVFSGTYTASGRVLVTGRYDTDPKKPDWYHLITMEDDGSGVNSVFAGAVPQKKSANGVRWMCFSDNRRILLGDYVLECEPDLDHCSCARLVPLEYPEEIENAPDVFLHWSEIIISPDCRHMCWTTLQFTGGSCYLGRLVRGDERYHLEDVCLISNTRRYEPDSEHEGCVKPLPVRGGEVKQFVRGGLGISSVGAGTSTTEAVVQALDSEEVIQVTNTPGYEETTMFSPDETLGVSMSPRFSDRTNGAVFGMLPHPNAAASGLLMNSLYMYSVAGVRSFRRGSIGPVLIEIDRSVQEGRGYRGVDLSDPEGKWVYCSPISWHPDSTRAMWVETTRAAEGPAGLRLRSCRLLDRTPSVPVPAAVTPSSDQIPYAAPIGTPLQPIEYPIRIAGRYSGMLVNTMKVEDGIGIADSVYENYSDDGLTFTDGGFRVTSPMNMFAGGRTIFEGKMCIHGAHNGRMDVRAVLEQADAASPAMLVRDPGEDGLPISRGYATYDGVTARVEDMEP